ncbi:DNA polymerase family A-domain-containing protein [Globomyces pollinis-pini]|nr:DNA polymerase family A-domain-containing protein [Globomyces pollinis-pini]
MLFRKLRISIHYRKSSTRKNEVGIQMLSKPIHDQIFKNSKNNSISCTILNQIHAHLNKHSLLGKTLQDLQEIDFHLPNLSGSNIEDHFLVLGLEQQQIYIPMALELSKCQIPIRPTIWSTNEGWTRYNSDSTTSNTPPAPGESIVLDVEVLYKISPYPVMATAVSKNAWYSWIMPGYFDKMKLIPDQLIPLGNPDTDRIIVGHNVSYDRARILEEYREKPTRNGFIDTLSLHSSIGGLSSQQKGLWQLYKKTLNKPYSTSNNDVVFLPDSIQPTNDNKDEYDWQSKGSTNSLSQLSEFYLKRELDKSVRDEFSSTDISTIRDMDTFQRLMTYCSSDVLTTLEIYQTAFPLYRQKCPHPVSFAGMLEMSKGYLPTNIKKWNDYITSANEKCDEAQRDISNALQVLMEQAKCHPDPQSDPWLKHLDWEVKKVKYTKPIYSTKDPSKILTPSRPYKNTNFDLINEPKWRCDLYDKKTKQFSITLSTRSTPYLLGLKWKGFPIQFIKGYGWTFYVPNNMAHTIKQAPLKDLPLEDSKYCKDVTYYHLPHPSGNVDQNCGNPLSKNFIKAFEEGVLTSSYPKAQELLMKHSTCSYWISARERIKSQFVVKQGDHEQGVILPIVIPMGTVTRRAVESTWLTASNAKKNRIGSELKSLISAPEGYEFVGADVDSQELWIASLLGDSQLGVHGGTAFGFMTLQGNKQQGTDLHTRTGKLVNVSRDVAKIFNYARIYGGGVKYAASVLVQNNPGLTDTEAFKKANSMYAETKGQTYQDYQKNFGKERFWFGGTESLMFNQLEIIAENQSSRTPVLGCEIPNTLLEPNTKKQFLTSRINWVVQSSGVDYLHLLLVSMNYLFRRFKIDGRFIISIHDEVRFMVNKKDTKLATLALQISNLWTRSMFACRLGLNDLPLNVAFFSLVDIDHVLRKEVFMDCITPSNPEKIPEGRSESIYDTLNHFKNINLHQVYGKELSSINMIKKQLLNQTLVVQHEMPAHQTTDETFIKAQFLTNNQAIKNLIKDKQSQLKSSKQKQVTVDIESKGAKIFLQTMKGR